MTGLMQRLKGGKPKSAEKAKERLKLVLIHDRTDLSPTALDELKNELISVISRYVDIDPGKVRIHMDQEGRENRLVADIPIKRSGRRRR
jgi:cell division topological specificity factor